MHCLLARKSAWLPLSETGTAQHFSSFSHFDGIQNVFSWLLPSCCFMTFFFNKSKRLWRLYFGDKLLLFYNISVHCALMSLSRKRAAPLSLIFICCALTLPLPRNPKSQSKGDMKTVTNVCKIFFWKKLPLRKIFWNLFAIKKIPALCMLFLHLLKQRNK